MSSLSLDSSSSGDSCSGHGGPVTNVTIPRPGKQQPRHSRQPRQRSASVYRMASTFELGDEQVFKKNKEKENGRNFGKKMKKSIYKNSSIVCPRNTRLVYVQFSSGPLIILIFQLPHMTTCLDLRLRQPSEE